MKTSFSRHHFLLVAVGTGAVVLSFAAFSAVVPRVRLTLPAFAPTPVPSFPISTGALYAPADHTRLMKIGTALQNKKPITDADLNWAIGLLQRGPVIDSSFTRTSFALRTMSQLINHRSMTPAQSHTLTLAVLSYADDPPPKEREPIEVETGQKIDAPAVSAQLTALTVLASLDDDAARAKLETLAKTSATLSVRQSAQGLIRWRVGETKTPLQ